MFNPAMPTILPGSYMCAACNEDASDFFDHAAGKCVSCDKRIEGCDKCYVQDGEIMCEKCRHGFYFMEEEEDCYDCSRYNKHCDQCDLTLCKECRQGYTLIFDTSICITTFF